MLSGSAPPLREREAVRIGLGAAAVVAMAAAITLLPVGAPVVIAAGVLAVAAGVWLLNRPAQSLALMIVAVVVCESDTQGFLPVTHWLYVRFPVVRLAPADLLVLLAFASAVLGRIRARRPLSAPGVFSAPLALVAVATVWGVIMGKTGPVSGVDLLNEARPLVVLLIVPLAVVNVVDDRATLRRMVALLAGLAVFKGAEGMVGWLLGAGRPLAGSHITFYEPTANFVLLALSLSIFAAFLLEGRVTWWAAGAGALMVVTLALSFRRSFWIAAVVGVVFVVAATSGRRRRPFVLLAIAIVGLSLAVGVRAGGGTESSALTARLQSLAPSSLSANAEDAYRLDEQRNVEAEIRQHPVTGLGLGVPWTPRFPLTESYAGATAYTHVVFFWWWMKLGLPGLVALLSLLGVGIVTAFRIGMRDPDPWGRAIGVGLGSALVGMLAAETTGSFTGVDLRYTVMLGVVIGLLAVADRLSALPAINAPEGGAAGLRTRARGRWARFVPEW